MRKWLKSRGKEHCIAFDDQKINDLRECFNSLDDDGSGSIGVDELEDPLIALGLVDNRQQVQSIVKLVDDDQSEMIEFEEFMNIIKMGGTKTKQDGGSHIDVNVSKVAKVKNKADSFNEEEGLGAIYQFFKDLTDGKLKIDNNDKIPFSLFIST